MTELREDAGVTPLGGSARLLLRSLGAAQVMAHGSDRAVLDASKPLALLAYLAAAPNRAASRASLTGLLWADLDSDAARHALRQTLWYLRKRLGVELVTASGDALQLSAELECDRDALLVASARADHESVVSLYAGVFLPHLAVPGGAAFDEWASLERRRLFEVFRHSAEAVVRQCLSSGHARDAVIVSTNLRDQDPYREASWRLVLEASISVGDALLARKEAEALSELAQREEFDLEPATQSLIRSARGQVTREGQSEAPARSPIEGTLVGREATFSALLAAWDACKPGRAVRVHVTALPGLGKSRLLRDFGSRVRALRGRVVAIGGSIGRRELPSAAASELAAALATLPGRRAVSRESAATLVALNPSLSTWFEVPPRHLPPDDVVRARALALRELAAAVSFEQPVALLIDDLHWWDEESLQLVAAALEGLGDSQLCVVTAGRPEIRHVAMVAEGVARPMGLEPLTPEQVDELVVSIASLPAVEWAATFSTEVWRASRGSPLLTLELLTLLEDHGLLTRVGGHWRATNPGALRAELHTSDVLRARLRDMDRESRWLLTLLAAAGAGVTAPILAEAADQPVAEASQRLAALEIRGLVRENGHGWRLAHDEMLEEVRRVSSPDATQRACATLGRALAASAADEGTERRAAALLVAGGDEDARRQLLRRFAARRYAQGSRETVGQLIEGLFGKSLSPPDRRSLAAAMPWSWRLGLVSRTRRTMAGAVAVSLAFLATTPFVRPDSEPLPDAVMGTLLTDSIGTTRMYRVALRDREWSPREPLELEPWEDVATFRTPQPVAILAAWDPVHERLVTQESVEGPNALDLFVRTGTRPRIALAPAPGDDGEPAVSPDGRLVAFATARWNADARYDIAIVDLATGAVTAITNGPDTDRFPVWSPRGDRLAFGRNTWGARPNELCVAALAVHNVTCTAMPEWSSADPLGWTDEDRIVFIERVDSEASLRVMRWSTGEVATIHRGPMAGAALSPDGRWMFCRCASDVSGALQPQVFPLGAPSLARHLALPPGHRIANGLVWVAPRSPEAATVTIELPPLVAPPGIPLKLTARVVDARGREVPFAGTLRWSVTDSVAARIDQASGILSASGMRTRVTVIASVGAARDSVTISVPQEPARVLLQEAWSDTTMPGWIPLGLPEPRVARGPVGRAGFLNNGDGAFQSGAVSRAIFDLRRGLAVDVELSTPVTRAQWQKVAVQIVTLADTSALAHARGRNAPPDEVMALIPCAFGYPNEAQTTPRKFATATSADLHKTFLLPSTDWYSGRWHSARVQLFPDGRCGIALDGRAEVVLPGQSAALRPSRIALVGNSAGTTMLVGRLVVWEGVPGGVDWSGALGAR